MQPTVPAPSFLVAGIVWCALALARGWPAVPDVGVALCAGLLLPGRPARCAVVVVLLAVRWVAEVRGADPFFLLFSEGPRFAAVAIAPFLGTMIRKEPLWWKIVGTLLGLAILQEAVDVPGVCWEAHVADLGYTILVLAGMALVLRAKKKAA
ncbi:MAG TPA: hypothetical protein VIM58_05085 [Candidatus Methylacidiphilales bacterium]